MTKYVSKVADTNIFGKSDLSDAEKKKALSIQLEESDTCKDFVLKTGEPMKFINYIDVKGNEWGNLLFETPRGVIGIPLSSVVASATKSLKAESEEKG
jgi:hypothetical protein